MMIVFSLNSLLQYRLDMRLYRVLGTRLCAIATLFFFAGSVFAQFGDGTGQVRLPKLSTSPESGEAIALQSDGKIVVGGTCNEGPCVVRLNADGTIDTGFNAGGEYPGKAVITPWIGGSSTAGGKMRIIVDEDGRILLATTCRSVLNAPNRFCIARLTTSGALDPSFTAGAGASGAFYVPITNSDNSFRAMHIARWTTNTAETRRRIILVGACTTGFQCMAVLNYADGSLDSSFNPPDSALADGLFSWRLASTIGNFAVGVISQSGQDSNGKIVVAGGCLDGSARQICLTKFNTDGSFDLDFDGPTGGGNGAFVLAAFREPNNPNRVNQDPIDLVEADDGRYYLLCSHNNGAQLCVYRLNRDGSLDEAFDNGAPFPTIKGRVVFESNTGFGVRVQVDKTLDGLRGAPVIGADCNGPCITRFRGTGPIDTTLTGPNGDAAGQFYFDPGIFNDSVNDMLVNAVGEIFVVGQCNGQICVIKFKQEGSLFTSECRRNVDADANVSAASDGMAIVRWMRGYTGAPAIPPGLGYDIDGDGAIDASRDGLLLIRRMLGFEADGVMNGISFAAQARRQTWPQIESYLRTRCRVPVSPIVVP
jgi:uncharacterized delta-60 repeat protein